MSGRSPAAIGFAAALACLGGCAHEAPEAIYPSASGAGWVVPASYAWPPKSASRSAGAGRPLPQPMTTFAGTPSKNSSAVASSVFARTLGDVPRPRTRDELRTVLPGGSTCLTRLGEQAVSFRLLEHELGIKTPIVVDGPIAGVRYYNGSNGPLVADCRLVLALALVGPELRAYGVSSVRFSGAYVFRLSNKHRVSLHAYGLAIDLHAFTRLGTTYEVQRDFRKGLGVSVSDDAPAANAIATRFRSSGLFHEYLTPDDNADHHDHVHVGVSPLSDEVQ